MPSLVSIADCPVETIIERAEHWEKNLQNPDPALKDRTVCLLFYEPSTRTRVAFEHAAHKLKMRPIAIASDSSSIQKGESLKDTILTLCAEGMDLIVLRHYQAGAAAEAAGFSSVPLINAGDGGNEHPTQALLDLMTIRRHKGRIDGLKVAIVGDVRHSRVAKSNFLCLLPRGAHVMACAPESMLPDAVPEGLEITSSLAKALDGADVVMALRIQTERQDREAIDLAEYVQSYQISAQSLAWAKPDAILMHPGPMNRGVELTDEVADGPRSVIVEQVRNGLFIRIAATEYALGRY